jgi:N-acetylglucosaminyldiphosphoundecaprenol N-acetyl-beta-D-mannosaminyltransferase
MAAGRVDLMGMPVDALTEPEVVGTIMGALEEGRGGSVITPHLEILRRFTREPDVRQYFDDAELIVADGQPLIWASRMRGTPLPERVAGSDLVWSLTAECALRDRTVYLLGGAPGACVEARRRLKELYPSLRVVGCESPPMGFQDQPGAVDAIKRRLSAAQPDIVFVALGFPKQEHMISLFRDAAPSAWFLGVGVSMSFVAGHVARAPDWAIRYGMEWLHRLCQEPRRLFKRYVVNGFRFAARVFLRSLWERFAHSPEYLPPRVEVDGVAAQLRPVFHHGQLERARANDIAELLESTPDSRVRLTHDDERQPRHTTQPPVEARPERMGGLHLSRSPSEPGALQNGSGGLGGGPDVESDDLPEGHLLGDLVRRSVG